CFNKIKIQNNPQTTKKWRKFADYLNVFSAIPKGLFQWPRDQWEGPATNCSYFGTGSLLTVLK
ncbi:MAG: hypothetical protein IK038_04040, partial [Bacteroidaceae bacterium]|nr:hypothetical protein [Bacteroidaceae bacterium]